MSYLSELSRNVVNARKFTLNGASVTSAAAPIAQTPNYVQVGDAQASTGFVTQQTGSFASDNSLFAIASTTNALGTGVQFQVYYDTVPPTNTFSLGSTVPILGVTPGSNLLFTAVSSSGGLVAVVGNMFDSAIGVNNGSFHVLTRPTTTSKTWTLAQSFQSSTAGQQLGSSVAISANGGVIAVGASGAGALAGAVLVYTFDAALGLYVLQTELVGTGAVGAAQQGTSVKISSDGTTIVSGGPADNVNTGAVWTFSYAAGAWSQVGLKVVPTGILPTGGANAGQSVALSGDGTTMAVAVATNTVVLNTGCVVMFQFVDGAWTEGATIYPLAASGNLAAPDLQPVFLNEAGDTLAFCVRNNNGTQGGTFVYNLSPSTGLWVNNGVARIATGATLITPANSGQEIAALSPDGSLLLQTTYSLVLNNTDSLWWWVFA